VGSAYTRYSQLRVGRALNVDDDGIKSGQGWVNLGGDEYSYMERGIHTLYGPGSDSYTSISLDYSIHISLSKTLCTTTLKKQFSEMVPDPTLHSTRMSLNMDHIVIGDTIPRVEVEKRAIDPDASFSFLFIPSYITLLLDLDLP